jgi:tRNA (mo5U34)-methyltransferase
MTDLAEYQQRIDAVTWYHEFDFPNGLRARANGPDVDFHHAVWRFISRELDAVDFSGKSVLEIGCWDGYWSFDAERRGARTVLATDDHTQNWAQSAGLLLAKELLGSAVQTKLDVSVYELDTLGERYDVILCLGVYYHLVDPFYAFAQIRKRCHENTVVIFEGDITRGMRANTAQMDLSDHSFGIFVPTVSALNGLLGATYFEATKQSFMRTSRTGGWVDRLRYFGRAALGRRGNLPPNMNRAVTVCKPFTGRNPRHAYRPPFGLAAYDERFSAAG